MFSYEDVPSVDREELYYGMKNHHHGGVNSPHYGGSDSPYFFGCGTSHMHGGGGFRPPVPLPTMLPVYPSTWERGYYHSRLNRILEDPDDSLTPYDLKGTGTKMMSSVKYGPVREFVRSPPSENMHTYYPYSISIVDDRDLGMIRGREMSYGDEDIIPMSPGVMGMEGFGRGDDGEGRKRKYEDIEDLDIPNGFKLPASKSPIMEAMAYCAIMKWGIEILQCQDQTDETTAKVIFRVLDFDLYYKYSCIICSKQNPTEDIGSRVKSLRRWFVNFPKKKGQKRKPTFLFRGKT